MKGNKLILSHDLAKSIDFKFNSVRHNRTFSNYCTINLVTLTCIESVMNINYCKALVNNSIFIKNKYKIKILNYIPTLYILLSKTLHSISMIHIRLSRNFFANKKKSFCKILIIKLKIDTFLTCFVPTLRLNFSIMYFHISICMSLYLSFGRSNS